ncbi:MAG: hypothetical protein U9Q74_16840, partial [Gemmatimonadota bacterium]|nr:hypothetical protein [Gemmatimonadota bacterium]
MLPFDWHAEDLTLTARSGQTSSLTRASDSGLAAFQDASGLVGYAARNAVRWHRDPATGLIGLLAENAITNLTKQASDVTQSPWVCRGTATPAKTLTGPDGVANSATVMTGVGQSGVNDFYQIVSKTAADGTRNEPCLWFYRVTTTGTVRFQNQQNITNGWWDIDLSKLAAGWNYLTRWHVAVTVNVDFSIKSNATGPQFSTGAAAGPVSFGLFNVQVPDTTVTTPSSPVPTGSSTATRQNDSNINWTFNGGTGLLSLLLEFIETGSVFGTGNYMLAMGTGAVYAGFRNHSGSNKYQGFHTNGGS